MVMRHIIILLALLCASCNASLPSIKPYKMDIQQGNVVTSKMMLQLKPGMTKSQVRYIMGTPLIQDGFHPDRWDYFYQMRKAGKIIEQRRVIMEFENDALKRVRGDVIPAGSDPAVPESQPSDTKAKSKKSKDKGLLDRLMFWKDDEEVTTPQAAPEDLVRPDGEQKSAPIPPKAPTSAPESVPESQPQPAPKEAPAPSKPETEPAPTATEPEAAPPATAPAEATPAPTPAPDAMPAPVAEPQPAEPVPAKTQPEPAKPQAETKQPAESAPEGDLPPEDAPGYFERMLEKIGF